MIAVLIGFAVLFAAFIPSPLRFFTSLETAPTPEVKAPPELKMAAMPPAETFAEIVQRPLFNENRLPDPARAQATADTGDGSTAPAASDLSQFKLVGVITASSIRIALVQRAGGETKRVRAGDTIDGWRIEKIDVSGVTASDGNRSARLVIPRAQNAAANP